MLSALLLGALALPAGEPVKPKVRAITGFVTIDAKSYPAQITDTVKFLHQVGQAVEAAGYQVAGIRISTQPFPQYTRGLSHADALQVLNGINDLAATLKFAPNIGPAMLNDDDDTAAVDLLIDVLSRPGNRLNANLITAGEDGIHWKAVRQAAHVIQQVGARSPHGQGNFNFAATAMLKPYGPFYLGAWHPGSGPKSFAIGLESANVVMDVFARNHDPQTAAKELTDDLSIPARAVEAAAKQVAEHSGWTYAGIDPTPTWWPDLDRYRHRIVYRCSIRFTGDGDSIGYHHARRQGRSGEADRLFRLDDSGAGRYSAHATLDGRYIQLGFDPRLFSGLRGRCRHRADGGRYKREDYGCHHRRCCHARLQVEQAAGSSALTCSWKENRRDD